MSKHVKQHNEETIMNHKNVRTINKNNINDQNTSITKVNTENKYNCNKNKNK